MGDKYISGFKVIWFHGKFRYKNSYFRFTSSQIPVKICKKTLGRKQGNDESEINRKLTGCKPEVPYNYFYYPKNINLYYGSKTESPEVT